MPTCGHCNANFTGATVTCLCWEDYNYEVFIGRLNYEYDIYISNEEEQSDGTGQSGASVS